MRQSHLEAVVLMIIAMFIFAVQDAISRHLAETYNTIMVVLIRYWFLALVVIGVAHIRLGGIARVARTKRLLMQISRGVLLAAEVVVTVTAFVYIGLIGSHAIFACYPLMALALAVPILGERVEARHWLAVLLGLVGVLVIIRPGGTTGGWEVILPIVAAFMFALYQILTRLTSREDSSETSFFWMALGGAGAITLIGPFFWEPIDPKDWGWMATLCLTSMIGHFLLIRALGLTQASDLQPYSYFQFVFAIPVGMIAFSERLEATTLLGAVIVVAAGILAMRRRQKPG